MGIFEWVFQVLNWFSQAGNWLGGLTDWATFWTNLFGQLPA